MLKMRSVVAMAMILMGIGYGLVTPLYALCFHCTVALMASLHLIIQFIYL